MVRQLRPVSDPLGSYLRVGRQDHSFLSQMLVEGRPVGSGFVADPANHPQHKDLWVEARQRGIETVLDPRTLDLSTPGGFLRGGAAELPWAFEGPHRPEDLRGGGGAELCKQLVEFVAEGGYSACLAPTHLVGRRSRDWLDVDGELVRTLRRELNENDRADVPIYYPLIARSEDFYDSSWRAELVGRIAALPVDAVWLRIHPFGTPTSGPLTLKRYLAACRDLHEIERPLVGEHTGAVGVGLMAFGALGGVESGITNVDHTDLAGWIRVPRASRGGGGEARAYLHQIAAFLVRSKARAMLEKPGMKAAHGCLDTACCPRGWRDLLDNYREHFVHRRAAEVAAISIAPEDLRSGHYMENFLRPATDRAVRAAEIEPSLESSRKRLDSWRGTLGADLTTHTHPTFSRPAAGRRLRRSA